MHLKAATSIPFNASAVAVSLSHIWGAHMHTVCVIYIYTYVI